MHRVHIRTYGCQMNERDSEGVGALLRSKGYVLVADEAEADIILINTCSIRGLAEEKAIGKADHLLRARREGKGAKFIGILGCMAQNRGAELLERLPDLDLIVGTQRLRHIPDYLSQRLASPTPAAYVDTAHEEGFEDALPGRDDGRQVSAFVSIQQGCDMKCAYCVVPKTRGPERSRAPESIVAEVRALAESGTREVTLLGQIVNQYGRGRFRTEGGISPFVRLLRSIAEVPGIERIRYTACHPIGYRPDLVAAHAEIPQLCAQVHLPFQSGSDKILRAMGRPYLAERIRRLAVALRGARQGMTLSTDVIVGFPGETDADFALTEAMFSEIGFEQAFLFKYSMRPGTPAEPLGDTVLVDVKEARLLRLQEQLAMQSTTGNLRQ
ncbi:MAG TPA: tRNA (N6-isopentenyl adenosine(37)-C2)-methylthiotransferase MiaB, partial [Opitutae bacterium]|nr:tRNA (N6-isopentenyl adenosine(37)-C2)-methylthiotransferase MiaB [Opitutae bacterium]